jgi:TetR/AcrR family transcriptional repressor of nem operon
MRVSREAAAASKARITGEAARLMRENGIAATSVADVMSAAGMTTGGFYKHFASKDEMAAAAVRQAFDSVLERMEQAETPAARMAARRAYLRNYLSREHIGNPGRGCPVAALGPDAMRAGDLLAPEFQRGVEETLRLLGADELPKSARAALMRQMASYVGALVLARAVGDGPLRAEILKAVQEPAKG